MMRQESELIYRKHGQAKVSRLAESERSSDGVLSAVWSANTNSPGANGRLLPGWLSGCRRGRGRYGRYGCPYVKPGCDRQLGDRVSVAESWAFSTEPLDSGTSSADTCFRR